MADIFREVDEQVRKDRAVQLWRKYGVVVIALALALVLGVAGVRGWRYFQDQQNLEASDKFAQAMELLDAGERAQSLNALTELANTESDGYPLLAAFEHARLLAEDRDTLGAVAIWDSIAASDKVGAGFRGTATLLSVMHQLEDGDPTALRARLEPLSARGEVFRPAALELLAALALNAGQREEAIRLYQEVADEVNAPVTMRARASQMLKALEG